jgi:cytochrome c oxidase subunit 1
MATPSSFATMIISVPTGIKIFNWLATLWGGKIQFTVPMMFAVGFLFQFLIAGLTGIMLAARRSTGSLGNSYFVVAHFHYVLVGAILFMIFAAFYYWYPKMTGRMLNETMGKWHFWLFSSAFISPSTSCTFLASWACRAGFTPTRRIAAG